MERGASIDRREPEPRTDAVGGASGRVVGSRTVPRTPPFMPVLDPAPPPVRLRRRPLVGEAEGVRGADAAALARHAARTGLPLEGTLAVPREFVGDAGGRRRGPSAAEVAPGILSVELPLTGGRSAAGLLATAGLFGGTGDPAAVVDRLLALSCGWETEAGRVADLEEELDDVTDQLSRSFEELSLYHRLTRNLQVSHDPAAFAEDCAQQVLDAAGADAAAVRVSLPGGPRLFTAGAPLLGIPELARLLRSAGGHDWSRPLVRNGPALDVPGLGAAAAAPVREAGRRYGWVVCANAADPHGPQPELGSVEANLLGTVATVLATHLRNSALFREKEQMLLESVLSLVHALDARDPYTRGHSERVAVVAHRLATQLGWSDEALDNLYLSGLLHDIGKVGIDDGVLRKPGRLTDEEFDQIRRHPVIGHEILSGVRGLRTILPGVRSHHEEWDGSGYPDGLAGEAIPEMARVMAVADAYDAMGSDRPYRDGMPVERIESIFREGRGSQWDPAALDAYFACAADVRRIWSAPGDTAGRLAARARRRVTGQG